MKKIAFLLMSLVLFWACDTKPIDEPEPEPAPTGFKKEDITFKWKLTAGKVTAPLAIPDIFDTSNPLISGNPTAMAAICTKNAILDLKADNNFVETSDCYAPFGAPNNPQTGTYTFNATEASISTTYTNPALASANRKVTIKSIDKTSTPNKMIVEFKTVQSGLEITTELTYEKQGAFAKEEILFKWKLTAGKVTTPVAIPDIFDATNPLISGNPTAMAALCTKNSVLEFRANNTFTETSDCYTALGAGNNPQAGTYTFNASTSTIATTYNNASSFPTVLVGRTVTIKSITPLPAKMVVEFKSVQSGIEVTTELTYEKQP
jgi:hypothetical protein